MARFHLQILLSLLLSSFIPHTYTHTIGNGGFTSSPTITAPASPTPLRSVEKRFNHWPYICGGRFDVNNNGIADEAEFAEALGSDYEENNWGLRSEFSLSRPAAAHGVTPEPITTPPAAKVVKMPRQTGQAETAKRDDGDDQDGAKVPDGDNHGFPIALAAKEVLKRSDTVDKAEEGHGGWPNTIGGGGSWSSFPPGAKKVSGQTDETGKDKRSNVPQVDNRLLYARRRQRRMVCGI
ncbi:MAG: hypothetical protein Q9219_002411 [cf. Caloplaca sp. 3 TL-2023]